ncbi:hypothetical protein BDZ89DRAFT_958593 [Hymenopellis radicata]|nr:hypothetical protein BDZ89DRAFT_958593 [Hymenopellis radicata]
MPSTTARPYVSTLQPLLSPLRPHTPARGRLVLWKPINTRTFTDLNGRPIDLPNEFIDHVQQVLVHGYAESTLETYASGLLAFHVFCDSRRIPEDQRAPASPDLISAWISTMAGAYAGASVKNYIRKKVPR